MSPAQETALERRPAAAEPAAPAVEDVLPGESAVNRAARQSLEGRRRGLARVWPFLGPAFIAAVAYIDPGNFATNVSGGAQSAICSSGWSSRRT